MRRDLHLSLPYAAGEYEITVSPDCTSASRERGNFKWQATEGKFAELSYDGIPVLRYVHQAYDNSSTVSRDKTYKVFHHLYDPAGTRFVTNGGDTKDPDAQGPQGQPLSASSRPHVSPSTCITLTATGKCRHLARQAGRYPPIA